MKMDELFDKTKRKIYHLKGISAKKVIEAEQKLGLRFSDEFRNYLMEYGAVSSGSHEFMGIGGDSYLDVVDETLRERENRKGFPKNCYIIENLGIDGILVLQDENGVVYEMSDAGLKRIFNSMKEYVEKILG